MRQNIGISIALVLFVAAAYWPVGHYGFVGLDDTQYVSQNPYVRAGLTSDGVAWAFTTFHAANWHPLAWLSHMVDCQFFGLDAGRHHVVNVVLHAANAVLLFLVLRRMTAARWPSALVAALFALHPLHVESVAWVSERKDVLGALFWILTMWTYAWYAGRPSILKYAAMFVLLALGLMAKPMLVTLPLVLLLLDYWPLRRLTSGRTIVVLVLEKAPLLVLSAASGVVTYLAQEEGGAMAYAERFSFIDRLSNALVAYVAYLGRTVWPSGLAVFYPYVAARPLWQPLAAGAFLAIVTALVIRQGRRRPYLPVGWFWYLGTLVPVIGLVQVGGQAMADRYTYVPLIGVFIMAAWGAADAAARWRQAWKWLVPVAGAALIACGILTARQVGYWSDSETLFRRALAVTSNSALAHRCLGMTLLDAGRYGEAVEEFAEVVRLEPLTSDSYNNLGLALAAQGRLADAVACYRRALALDPANVIAHGNLADALRRVERTDEAGNPSRESP